MKIELKNYPNISKVLQKRYDKLEYRKRKQQSRINRLQLDKRFDACQMNIEAAQKEISLIVIEMDEIEAAVKELQYSHLEAAFIPSKQEIDTTYDKMFIGSKQFEIDLND